MRLKNILIIVDDIEESVRFYKDLFGLQVILKEEGNNNVTELYFEENNMEAFIRKLESYDFYLNYVTELTELEGGQKLVRFYDPSGNLIEVRTPINNYYHIEND